MKRLSLWLLPIVLVLGTLRIGFSKSHTSSNPSKRTTVTDTRTSSWSQNVLDTLSLNQKVSQLLIVEESSVSSPTTSLKATVESGVGGVRLCTRSPLLQASYTNQLQAQSPFPLLVTQNLECQTSDFNGLPMQALAATGNSDLVYSYARQIAAQAQATGAHQLYAPANSTELSWSADQVTVRQAATQYSGFSGAMVDAFLQGVDESGLLSSVTYRPQYNPQDRSTGTYFQTASVEGSSGPSATPLPITLGEAVRNNLQTIVVTWSTQPGDRLPPIRQVRRNLSYNGLITSDLSRSYRGLDPQVVSAAAVEALERGSDQIIVTPENLHIRRSIVQAVQQGILAREKINASVMRILQAKEANSLHKVHQVDLNEVTSTVRDRTTQVLFHEVARRSVTLLQNTSDVVPFSPTASQEILSVSLSDRYDAPQGRWFAQQLQQQKANGTVTRRILNQRSSTHSYDKLLFSVNEYDALVVSLFANHPLSSRQKQFLEEVSSSKIPVVLVNFGPPQLLTDLSLPDATLVTYTASHQMQQIAAEALFGRSAITGRLPVTISARHPSGSGITVAQQSLRHDAPETVGMSNTDLSGIDRLMHEAVADSAFPGAAVAVGRSGVLTKLTGYGYQTYKSSLEVTPHSSFDLASLTKVVATTTAAMKLYEENKLELTAPVSRYWPAFGQKGKGDITIRHLLTHTSGLRPFYHPMTPIYGTPFFRLPRPYTPFFRMEIQSQEEMFSFVAQDTVRTRPGQRYRYSDFNMITLAHVIEKITGESLDSYLQRKFFKPLGMKNTGFRSVGPKAVSQRAVPTEADHSFRARLMRGEVHDEAAYIMGGTAGHAGLFSTAHDLALFADMLVRGGKVNGRQFLKKETIKLFTAPANPSRHSRALGWDTKSPSGYSSAGDFFGPNSFGHTGFTGTSLWIDPDQDLFVVLLTNRVYPTRANRKHIPLRPAFADKAYTAIKGPPSLLISSLLDLP